MLPGFMLGYMVGLLSAIAFMPLVLVYFWPNTMKTFVDKLTEPLEIIPTQRKDKLDTDAETTTTDEDVQSTTTDEDYSIPDVEDSNTTQVAEDSNDLNIVSFNNISQPKQADAVKAKADTGAMIYSGTDGKYVQVVEDFVGRTGKSTEGFTFIIDGTFISGPRAKHGHHTQDVLSMIPVSPTTKLILILPRIGENYQQAILAHEITRKFYGVFEIALTSNREITGGAYNFETLQALANALS